MEDYTILPQVEGHGRFLGCNLGVIADAGRYYRSWWGEGEVKVYLDSDTSHPTLCGTGTEDYIGTTAGDKGQYAGLYQGCHVADHEKFHYCFYRLRPGSIWFHTLCRATIKQIGAGPASMARMYAAGLQLVHSDKPLDTIAGEARARTYGLFERQDDVSSRAWFYLNRPTNDLPALPPTGALCQVGLGESHRGQAETEAQIFQDDEKGSCQISGTNSRHRWRCAIRNPGHILHADRQHAENRASHL